MRILIDRQREAFSQLLRLDLLIVIIRLLENVFGSHLIASEATVTGNSGADFFCLNLLFRQRSQAKLLTKRL